jgi:hypothetical protein
MVSQLLSGRVVMRRFSQPPKVYSTLACFVLVGVLFLPSTMLGSLNTVVAGEVGLSLGAPLEKTTLTLGSSVGTHLNGPFYAVVVGDGGLQPSQLLALGSFLNSTPISFIRFGDGGPAYDPTTGLSYSPPARGGTYLPVNSSAVDYPWLKAWCDSRTPHCVWIADLPAEQNNTTFALHVVKWYHDVLGFVPTMWEFGNEPSAWTHYGINLTKWSTKDVSVPTPQAYATMAQDYITAIHKLYPTDRFIAIESACACDHTFITAAASVIGSEVAAFAYHLYPSATNSTTSLSQYYGALLGPSNIPNSTALLQMGEAAGCTNCANLPVEIGEYQGGPANAMAAYDLEYPGAAFMAASTIQAIDDNISTFTAFDINRLYSERNGTLAPEGLLYQRILDNMTMGTDYAVSVHAGTLGGIFALEIKNGTRESLLLVNTNMTDSLSLTIASSLFPISKIGSMWTWSPSLVYPYFHRTFTLPTLYIVPRQGILLLTNY